MKTTIDRHRRRSATEFSLPSSSPNSRNLTNRRRWTQAVSRFLLYDIPCRRRSGEGGAQSSRGRRLSRFCFTRGTCYSYNKDVPGTCKSFWRSCFFENDLFLDDPVSVGSHILRFEMQLFFKHKRLFESLQVMYCKRAGIQSALSVRVS